MDSLHTIGAEPAEPSHRANDTSLKPTLKELVQGHRAIFEQVLEHSLGNREVAGACFYAAFTLQVSVEKFLGFKARVRGGDGVLDGGYVAADGQRYGHYWVEAQAPGAPAGSSDASESGKSWVLDVTADQFGDEPVIIAELPGARQKYLPGDQATVDAHVALEMAAMEEAAREAAAARARTDSAQS